MFRAIELKSQTQVTSTKKDWADSINMGSEKPKEIRILLK
jgi:hypothetical protein